MWSRRSQVKAEVPGVAPANVAGATLIGRRLVLRPLVAADFDQWREVRLRCEDWLTKWEPARIEGAPDTVGDRQAFAARCGARTREIQMGSGYGFGMFHAILIEVLEHTDPLHKVTILPIGMALGVTMQLPAEDRHSYNQDYLEDSIVVAMGGRVAEKLELRNEGVAERYLEINGVWEDHVRYAITSEEWAVRRDEILAGWAY